MKKEEKKFNLKKEHKIWIIIGIGIILLIIILCCIFKNKDIKLEDITNKDGLIFEIHYTKLDCHGVSLEVYNDNTYKYYDTYKDGKYIDELNGTYIYNVENIINTRKGIKKRYLLTTGNNKKYKINANNEELNNFLKSININLETCSSEI